MKEIKSLSELIEYVHGRGTVCEVSHLYSLCEKLEQRNTELEQRVKELEEEVQGYIEDLAGENI